MGITVGLQPPTLSAADKHAMKAWLREQLASDELASSSTLPVSGLAIYINGEARLIQFGYWNARNLASPTAVSGNSILAVGSIRTSTTPPTKPERLAILGGIIGCVGMWDELTTNYRKAVSRVILEAYNSCFFDMIQAPQPAVKLAFSADKQMVALQYRDDESHWYIGSGESVSVDESWQIVNA